LPPNDNEYPGNSNDHNGRGIIVDSCQLFEQYGGDEQNRKQLNSDIETDARKRKNAVSRRRIQEKDWSVKLFIQKYSQQIPSYQQRYAQ
jgi:hypothetical protein